MFFYTANNIKKQIPITSETTWTQNVRRQNPCSLEKDIKDDIGVGGKKNLTSEPRPVTKTPNPCKGGRGEQRF